MQKLVFIISAIIGTLCILFFSAQSPLDAQVTRNGGRGQDESVAAAAVLIEQQPPSCATPDATMVERCKQWEASILDVTLRLELALKTLGDEPSRSITVTIAHATVVGGRFLVTHNHFALSPGQQHDSQLLSLSAYHPDATPAIHQAPPHTFRVFSAGPQTLVFDFGEYGGQGAFDYMGIASAQVGTWQALGLRPGMEVAQVDWDGQNTHVDWVRVSRIDLDHGIPALELENYVAPGASGGGVFYADHHVANNWFRSVDKEFSSGTTVAERTFAALNETVLTALLTGSAVPAQATTARLSAANSPLNQTAADFGVR